METELKLRFSQTEDMADFLRHPWLQHLVMPDSCVETRMISRYYDTAEQILTQMNTSLRIREENDRRVATVKIGGQASNGLHQRQEWSVDIDEDEWPGGAFEQLDTHWFEKNAVSDGDPDQQLHDLLKSIAGQPLIEICQANFLRTAYDVGYGDTLMELALDAGELNAGNMTAPILELELELKEGDVRDLMDLGEELQARFGLRPESLSKYARCLELLRQQPDLQDA